MLCLFLFYLAINLAILQIYIAALGWEPPDKSLYISTNSFCTTLIQNNDGAGRGSVS